MRDTKELLRETRDRIAPPLDVLGSLERRRHHREQVRRGSAAVVAIVIALVGLGGWFVIGRDAAKVPVDDPTPSAFRRDGEFIVFTPRATGSGWDLAAQDPATGEVRTIVETDGIVYGVDKCSSIIAPRGPARTSSRKPSGRLTAAGSRSRSPTSTSTDRRLAPCGPTVGIWVQGHPVCLGS